MRRLIAGGAALAARAARRARRIWLKIRLGLAERELQLLNHHAQRMAAERLELCERRGRLALELLRLEALLRDFLALDDWRDDAIAPAELIERARAEVGDNAEGDRPPRTNDGQD